MKNRIPKSNYFVTNACQGCVAHPCILNCPKGAISMVDGQAKIDSDKCVNCGICMRECPFGAIVERSQMIDVLKNIKTNRDVVAMIAPAMVGQFSSPIEAY